MPVPASELPILEALVNIRARLTKLKKDRTEYIRASDVMQVYAAVIKQVNKLNEVRDESANAQTSSAGQEDENDLNRSESPHTNNRLDTTLNDVFQLLSLFFLTIGKSRESPAAYCQLATMKQLLEHMDESGVYTEADLKPFQERLDELRTIIIRDEDKEIAAKKEAEVDGIPDEELHPEGLTKLLLRKWEACSQSLVIELINKLPNEYPVPPKPGTPTCHCSGPVGLTFRMNVNILHAFHPLPNYNCQRSCKVDGFHYSYGASLLNFPLKSVDVTELAVSSTVLVGPCWRWTAMKKLIIKL